MRPRSQPTVWLTKREAAAHARCSTRTIERAAAAGTLEAHGTPGKRSYRLADVDAWLERGGR